MKTVDSLIAVVRYENEWPARVGEFIASLAEWCSAHPLLSEYSAEDIAGFLLDVWEDCLTHESVVHISCGPILNEGATGGQNTRWIVPWS